MASISCSACSISAVRRFAKKVFPFVALLEGNIGFKRLFYLGLERFEIELPPFLQARGQFWLAVRRTEIRMRRRTSSTTWFLTIALEFAKTAKSRIDAA